MFRPPHRAWDPAADNRVRNSQRRLGRCTYGNAVCQAWNTANGNCSVRAHQRGLRVALTDRVAARGAPNYMAQARYAGAEAVVGGRA